MGRHITSDSTREDCSCITYIILIIFRYAIFSSAIEFANDKLNNDTLISLNIEKHLKILY